MNHDELLTAIDGLRARKHGEHWKRKHQPEIDALPDLERAAVLAHFDAKLADLDRAWVAAHPEAAAAEGA